MSVSYFLRPSNTSSPLTIMFHCVCVCLYSFLVRTGNKTPNFIMGHYDKSRTLDICSSLLLLEILKNNLSFHLLPDSALGVGTCSWPVAAEHRNSTIQAGQGVGIARPVPKSGGRCALASVCSGLHLLLPFPNVCLSPLPSQVKQGSAHPAAPTSPFVDPHLPSELLR